MCPINGYFDVPFAVGGDVSPVPDATQPSGTVSYEQGYPVGYSTPVASGGFNVPRTSFNQIFNDITTALQYFQQGNAAAFITTTMNGGTAYSYPANALVLYGGVVYLSLVGSNTDTPPSSKWAPLTTFPAATKTQTGATYTYAAADAGLLVLRSNSGAVMTDTLPGTSPGVLAKGWAGTVVNNDATALLYLAAGAGASFNGSATGLVVLGPGQKCSVFSDGTSYWATTAPGRARLGANTSFAVSTAGSDANPGTTALPWATLQHAWDTLCTAYDLNGFTATIQGVSGQTFTAGRAATNGPVGGTITIDLATSQVATTAGSALSFNGILSPIRATVQNLKVVTTSGNGIFATNGANVKLGAGIVFGACSQAHLAVDSLSLAVPMNSYTISGSAANHWYSIYNSQIFVSGITVTLTGTPAFTQFAFCTESSSIDVVGGTAFSGSATGSRYGVSANGVINTAGGGTSFLPGNSAGTTGTGGQYL